MGSGDGPDARTGAATTRRGTANQRIAFLRERSGGAAHAFYLDVGRHTRWHASGRVSEPADIWLPAQRLTPKVDQQDLDSLVPSGHHFSSLGPLPSMNPPANESSQG